MRNIAKFMAIFSLLLILSGCTGIFQGSGPVDPAREALMADSPPVLKVCSDKINASNAELAICVHAIALQENDSALCRFSPEYKASTWQEASRAGVRYLWLSNETCLRMLGRISPTRDEPGKPYTLAWSVFFDRPQPEVIASLNRMHSSGYDFNSEYFFKENILDGAIAASEWPRYGDLNDEIGLILTYGAVPRKNFLLFAGLQCGAASPRADLMETMIANGANASGFPYQVDFCRSAEVVRILLEHGADANELGLLRDTIYYGSFDVAKLLVEHGADVNQRDEHGETPIFQAIRRYEDPAPVAYLVEHGAKLNVTSNSGLTPLGLAEAIQKNGKNRTEVIKLIERYQNLSD